MRQPMINALIFVVAVAVLALGLRVVADEFGLLAFAAFAAIVAVITVAIWMLTLFRDGG